MIILRLELIFGKINWDFTFFSVHLREPLPTPLKDLDVHGTEGGQSLWATGYVEFPEVCPEETFVRVQDWSVFLRTKALDEECHVGVRGSE